MKSAYGKRGKSVLPRLVVEFDDVKIKRQFLAKVRANGFNVKRVIMDFILDYLKKG